MADDFKNIVFGLVLFVAFSWIILGVAVDFGTEYGVYSDDVGDGSLNIADFQTTAEGVEGSAQSYRERFESGDVDNIDDASGMFSVITDVVDLIITPFKLLSQIAVNIFHAPPLFINVILGLLAIGLILAVWSVLRSGT